jgi:hypothetical protein
MMSACRIMGRIYRQSPMLLIVGILSIVFERIAKFGHPILKIEILLHN